MWNDHPGGPDELKKGLIPEAASLQRVLFFRNSEIAYIGLLLTES